MKRISVYCAIAILLVSSFMSGCGPQPAPASPLPTASDQKPAVTQPPAPVATQAPAKPATATPVPSKPQPSGAAFYKGKVIEMVVGHAPGGGWDTWARMLAPYYEKYLGATIVVRNIAGASGKVAMTKIRDENNGLTIGMMITRSATLEQLFTPAASRFDMSKFSYLGVVASNPMVFVVSSKSGIKSIDDLRKVDEIKGAVDSPDSGKAIRVRLLSMAIQKPIKVVTGYSGSSTEVLAVMRGEVTGSVPGTTAIALIESGDLVPLVTVENQRNPMLPNIPSIYELRSLTPQEKETMDLAYNLEPGRALFTAPGVSPEKLDFLRECLKKACEEPALKEKAAKFGEPVDYKPGEVMAKAVNDVLNMSEANKGRIGALLAMENR